MKLFYYPAWVSVMDVTRNTGGDDTPSPLLKREWTAGNVVTQNPSPLNHNCFMTFFPPAKQKYMLWNNIPELA